MLRARALLALTACGLACGGEAASPPRSVVWRAIEPPAGSDSMASIERVEIAAQTRPVLGAQPLLVLRWRESITLPPELSIARELPPDLAPDALVAVDTWVSVRRIPESDAEANELKRRPGRALARLRAGDRQVLRDGPVVVSAGQPSVARIAVPPELQGRTALLSATGRPLPEAATLTWRTEPFDVPPGARLGFGYAVEEEGWSEGWPPVDFRVRAEPEGEPARIVFERRLDPARRPEERRWLDASVDLDALAGRRARLRFEAEALAREPGASVPRSLPVFGDPVLTAPRPEAGRSIVLVSLDTLRARSVSAYGCARATMPSLDRNVVAAGALVRHAVTPFPFTPPSHMSMLSGLEPCMHGVLDRHGVLPSNQLTLAELLRAAGYRSAAFTENAYVSAGAGFARGFDVYVERRDERHPVPGYASETFRSAAAWLASVDERPFFLFVHTYQVHDPYEPPPEYREFFVDDLKQGAPPRHQEELRDYEREIRYTDDLLAEFLSILEEGDLAEQSIVVVTSDHGEAFGEHMALGHGYDAHDEAVLVPLVLRAPGLIAPGLVVEEQVSLVDLVPTLLDLVGVAAPAELAGRSFAPLLRGEAAGFEEHPILIQTVAKQVAVRTPQYKYIEYGRDRAALHRLGDDPLERKNAVAGDPAAVAEARDALRRGRDACEAWHRENPPQEAAREQGRRAPGWLVNRDEIDARLRALGYAE